MNKDIIYIDVEDDITAIIGKIKASKDKIVALVPPKRVGVLQSAVNLRLLSRAALNANKNLVLVTTNKALIALSAASMIPVAYNLHSKPEIVEVEKVESDDSDDVIDGSQMPVGDLVSVSDSTKDEKEIDLSEDIKSMDIDSDIEKTPKDGPKNTPSKIKVPDFSSFRKKIFIGGVVVIALTAFLVWANIYAPAATVIISTNTSPAPFSATLKLGAVEATDVAKGTIQTISKQIKKDVSVQFDATGKKDLGNKATGTVSVANCDSSSPITLASGTIFVASSGERYVNNSQSVIPGFSGSASACRDTGAGAGTLDIAVTAVSAGEVYNISAKNFSIVGVTGDVYASGSTMTGGTTKMATVVTAADIQKAAEALVALSSEDVKQQLINQFNNGEFVINDSFNIDRAAGVSKPAVDNEATGKATLTSSTTFSITAISRSEMELYLRDVLAKQVGDNQKIYDSGIDNVKLSGYLKNDQSTTINATTIGRIGPNIDADMIKNQAKGKKYGIVQSEIGAMRGVSSVDIKFPYFWINTVPNDITKIEVEFISNNG
jgi:hypothetical protein